MIPPVRGGFALALIGVGGLVACEATEPKQVEDPDSFGVGEPGDAESGDSEELSSEKSGQARDLDGEPLGADPVFTDNMSVDDAIGVVPPDSDRLNIEQEVLAEPLQQTELYQPCKLGAGHFTARVAFWNGRAVGVDVETEPNNQTLAKCIDSRIRQVEWSEKVRSLNTVEYSY